MNLLWNQVNPILITIFLKKGWGLNYPSIGTSDFEGILNMRRYSKGIHQPLWMCIDSSKPHQTEFVRIVSESFLYSETVSSFYNVSFKVEQEILICQHLMNL